MVSGIIRRNHCLFVRSQFRFQIESGLKEPPVVYVYPSFGPYRAMWGVLEYPETSSVAKVFATMSVLVIAASLVLFVAETVPGFGNVETSSDEYVNKTHEGNDFYSGSLD